MGADNVLLPAGQRQLLGGVAPGDFRVPGPVALVGRVAILGVIEKVVVKQSPPGHLPHVEAAAQQGRHPAAVVSHRHAVQQAADVKAFLQAAQVEKELLLEKSKEDLKELALAIAEKVIRVSLRSSSDILIRMIEAATAKKRRCEWVQIYIADCDARTNAQTIPELTEAMRHPVSYTHLTLPTIVGV